MASQKPRNKWADRFWGHPPIGCIYEDTSTKGKGRHTRRSNTFRAEVTINRQRFRHRSSDYYQCELFLFKLIFDHRNEMRCQESISSLIRNWSYE